MEHLIAHQIFGVESEGLSAVGQPWFSGAVCVSVGQVLKLILMKCPCPLKRDGFFFSKFFCDN